MTLEQMQRRATLLGREEPSVAEELAWLIDEQRRRWPEHHQRNRESGGPVAAEGTDYHDTRKPHAAADFAAVTLLTTSLMLWPTALWTPTPGGNYWWVGKKLRLRGFGKITTAATPGNLTVEVRYGTTDAGGVILATSAALTLIANQTAISWDFDIDIECRALGATTAGSLFATGEFHVGTAVVAAGQTMIPASAAVAAGVDTTGASGLNVQMKRSGSTVETATLQRLTLESLN